MSKPDLGNFSLLYKSGWILLVVSFIIYLLPGLIDFRQSDMPFVFFIGNFLFALGYFISMWVVRFRQEKPRPNIPFACWVHFVLLFTISAFSLNKSLTVFAPFPLWLDIYTLLGATLFLTFPYFKNLPVLLQKAIWILVGAELLLSLYFVLYLMPLMPISIIAFWFFGLTLHTFVPVLWLLLIFLLIRQEEKVNYTGITIGFILPLIVLGLYLGKWYQIQDQIRDIQAENHMNSKDEIPVPIALAQWLPADKLTEEILVSPAYSQKFWGSAWGMDFNGERRYHNPLAVLGNLFFGEVDLDQEATTALMNIRRDQRHRSEERLWSGSSLSTTSIASKIQVYPNYRMAYHEKILTIHNNPEKTDRDIWFVTPTQLALYTFHLPEGSIVTSLSLWIDGKEQKSRLTTRKKADSAFRQVVDVERRDPALVHWKEGNQVVVSIFPCTAKEDRIFKIGFTTPLKLKDDQLWLENIWFEGPDGKRAREICEIQVLNAKQPLTAFEGFDETASGSWIRKGDYQPYWKFPIPLEPLSNQSFVFHNKAYQVKEEFQSSHPVKIQSIYFDLNAAWNKEELDEMLLSFQNKDLYVLSADMEKISSANAGSLYQKYKQSAFSLPYLHRIKNPESSLVVSHTSHRSPLLREMKQSAYADRLTTYFLKQKSPCLVVNIGEELSPLYKTLNELRVIRYLPMDIGTLKNSVLKNEFLYTDEGADHILMHDSKMVLSCRNADTLKQGQAPDHLMRLFAYNDIVRKVGKDFFNSEQYEQELFREAEEAYVLSPVTSLIVLESEVDYKRMGIDKNKDTLGNAEILEGGAVPEPHEWVLILFVVLLALFFKFRSKSVFV